MYYLKIKKIKERDDEYGSLCVDTIFVFDFPSS